MKINEIVSESLLFELREYLNSEAYGAWINVKTKEVYTIYEDNGHAFFVDDHPELFFPDGRGDINSDKLKDAFDPLYNGEWVRVTLSDYFNLNGTKNSLMQTKRIWMPSAIKSDGVYIDIIMDDDNDDTTLFFDMPIDKIKLMNTF